MSNLCDTFEDCKGLYSKSSYKVSQMDEFFIVSTANWIIDKIRPRLSYIQYSSKIVSFKKSIIDFLTLQFKSLNCANLRTTAANSNLYKLANEIGIPKNVLPKNISIIINNEMCYYLEGNSLHKNIIAKF